MLDTCPHFDPESAERLARDHFGVSGRATGLTSERDQNFCIESADGTRIVLKIANAREDRAMLEAQQRAMMHVAERVEITPRVLRTASGDTIASVRGSDGREHLAWAISWLPGQPLGATPRRSTSLLEDFGRSIGALTEALADFDAPAIHRDFYWDLANGRAIVARYRALVRDNELGRALDALIAAFDRHTAPLLSSLPRAAIHGDPNDFNVLVGGDGDVERRDQQVTGFVDFGDMTHSFRIGDLAIAIAYVILGDADPLGAAASMVRGYCERMTPTDDELAALFGLVALRLCTSACIAADQQAKRPDNEYLGVSQRAIARTLPVLARIPFRLAEAVFREAAGVRISPAADRVVAHLARQREIASVLGIDPQREPSIVVDLSVASPLIDGDPRNNAEPLLTKRVLDAMRQANVKLAIGRYDEPRLIYTAPEFAGPDGPYAEHRTIHIGLDLFAPVGTPVLAPLKGVVHAFADNRQPLDYGR